MILRSLQRLIIILMIGFGNASAHPHMFIDWAVEPVIEDSLLTGVRVVWTFDEMNSSTMLEEYDLNKNGTLDENEVNSIRIKSLPGLAGYNYFMIVSWAKKALKVRKVEQFRAMLKDSRITYTFVTPCSISLTEFTGKNLTVAFSDPSMFVAFDIGSAQQMQFNAQNLKITTTKKAVDYLPTVLFKFVKL